MAALMLVSLNSEGHIHLIIGTNALANSRCSKSLAVGATPIIIAPTSNEMHHGLKRRIENQTVCWIQSDFLAEHLTTLGRSAVGNFVDAVFVTSTCSRSSSPTPARISRLCQGQRIPVNVVDAPTLCTFSLLSTHSDGPLQIGITTSGRGCKLAARIRRHVVSTLPPNFGNAVEYLGRIRRRIQEEDRHEQEATKQDRADRSGESTANDEFDDEASSAQPHQFNQFISGDQVHSTRSRRMRWLAQICEYWSLKRLSQISEADVETILAASLTRDRSSPTSATNLPTSEIYLAGSGPGSPLLLTLATHEAIQRADVILADKLVPAPVLDLIPRRTTVHIARKFPGNAEAAQAELLDLGLDALRNGHTVLRLKQGDPYIYGRGAEEYAFFSAHGYTPIVLPGITSALSAPLFAQIPCTHRSVADEVLVCTGTGRKGAAPDPPTYRSARTVVFLMALHRLASLVESLIGPGGTWPAETPCAVIERASCSDQRVVRTTLAHVAAAVEEEGSRPPGLLVVGWSCGVLCKVPSGTGGEARWIVEEKSPALSSLELMHERVGEDAVSGNAE